MFHSNLFSKEISPACQYCQYGFLTRDGKSVLCEKKGVMSPDSSCHKYRYAPLKRIPKRPKPLPKMDPSDFEL